MLGTVTFDTLTTMHGTTAANLLSIPGFTDPVSSLTHLAGAVVFALLGVSLVRRGASAAHEFNSAERGERRWRVVSLAIFAMASVFLLSMSGVFHLLRAGGARDVFQRLDHAAIFVLIAGTFTPIHSIMFRGPWRWGMLAFIWTLAICGVTLKSIFFSQTPAWLGLLLYVGMGWVGLFSMIALTTRYGFGSARPILFGGVAYTIGAAVELIDPAPLIGGVVRAHELFHVAVLVGLSFHWKAAWNAAGHAGPNQRRSNSENWSVSGESPAGIAIARST